MVFFPWPLSHDKGSFQVHLGAADPSALLQLGVLGERFHSVGVQDLKAGGTVRRQRQGGLPSSWEPGLKNKGLQTGLRGDKSSPSVKTYEPFKVLRSQPALRVEIVWGEGAGQREHTVGGSLEAIPRRVDFCHMHPVPTSSLVHRFLPGVSLSPLWLGWAEELLGLPPPVIPSCLNRLLFRAGGDDQPD